MTFITENASKLKTWEPCTVCLTVRWTWPKTSKNKNPPTDIFISQFSANVSKNEIIKSRLNKSWYVKWYPSDEKLIPSGVRVGDRLSLGVKTGKTQIKLLFDFDEKFSKFLF